jgi:hypothetical protein
MLSAGEGRLGCSAGTGLVRWPLLMAIGEERCGKLSSAPHAGLFEDRGQVPWTVWAEMCSLLAI